MEIRKRHHINSSIGIVLQSNQRLKSSALLFGGTKVLFSAACGTNNTENIFPTHLGGWVLVTRGVGHMVWYGLFVVCVVGYKPNLVLSSITHWKTSTHLSLGTKLFRHVLLTKMFRWGYVPKFCPIKNVSQICIMQLPKDVHLLNNFAHSCFGMSSCQADHRLQGTSSNRHSL